MSLFIDHLAAIVGSQNCLTSQGDLAPYLVEERGLYHGSCRAVVKPGSTSEVAKVVALCAEAGESIVPQGGRTGLCGGAVSEMGQVVLNLSRLNRIRSIDAIDYSMVCEAGVILATAQEAALQIDRLFPLSLAAEGSCQIGGVISTNAGGVNVLRYGNARDLVLGVEVVLADGQVWNGLKSLRKDNTGYDLKQLFIGGEGTLGIITAATLKLFPRPREVETAFCAIPHPQAAVELLAIARAATGDAVSAFELLPRIGLEFVCRHIPGCSDPLSAPSPWYVLIELTSAREGGELRAALEIMLEKALELGLVTDAVLASSKEQRSALWRLRESLPEAQKFEGGSIKHDVSVSVSKVPEFLERATKVVLAALPGVRPVPFGHIGDGNIHFNLTQPVGTDKAEYLEEWERMNRIVHDIIADLGGSFSAEHGIGQLKLGEMEHYKSPLELDLMRKIKRALDPKSLMNPGKVVRL
jgi:D-lactate dehydrogenase (cytochrome)